MGASTQAAEGERRSPRYKVRVRAKVTFETAEQKQAIDAQAYDLSENGLALFAPTDMEVGKLLKLELTIPYSGEKLVFDGVVCNRESFRYGIAFTERSVKLRELITRYYAAMDAIQ